MASEQKEGEVEADEIVTMQDILEEQEELTRDADAVLGASDSENCTYQLGYVGRQALYSCKTCFEKSGVKAGICLACSLKCHDGHDLFELYTKRNFRCDCGLKDKFPETECELDLAKGGPNDRNLYNQNFDGKYCSCHRPYPDPDYSEDDVMIQCIACEDWFHGAHLGVPVPDVYCEMICKSCSCGLDFLRYYRDEMAVVGDGDKVDEIDVREENLEGYENQGVKQEVLMFENESRLIETEGEAVVKAEDSVVVKEENSLIKREASPDEQDQPTTKKLKTEKVTGEQGCKLTERKIVPAFGPIDGTTFWGDNWRVSLCKCPECMTMYEQLKCVYLTDPEDTIHSYEEKGRKRNLSGGSSIEEAGQAALSTIPRTAQIEMIHGYNDLKEELSNFLRPFAEKGEVITKEHVARFIDEFKKKKESEAKVDVFSGCR